MTVRQLCQELGHDEFRYWVARQAYDPLPDPWLMHAIQTSEIVNAMGGKTKPKDYMPPRRVFRRASTDEIKSKIEKFKLQYNSLH